MPKEEIPIFYHSVQKEGAPSLRLAGPFDVILAGGLA
jgi:hypothetical protein